MQLQGYPNKTLAKDQIAEIRRGIASGIDHLAYAKPNYPGQQEDPEEDMERD